MSEEKNNDKAVNEANSVSDTPDLLERMERAIKSCKLYEVFLEDIGDVPEKIKAAQLRAEKAHCELMEILREAGLKGIRLKDDGLTRMLFSAPRADSSSHRDV